MSIEKDGTVDLFVFIEPSGMEKLAKGQAPHYWDFSIRDNEKSGPKDSFLVAGPCKAKLPPPIACAERAMASLQEKLKEHRAAAFLEEQELQTRINNLLALSYSGPLTPASPAPSSKPANDSDDNNIPF